LLPGMDSESDSDFLTELHRRLVEGDSIASAQISEELLPWLCLKLTEINPRIQDSHIIMTACADALLTYLKKPTAFDSEKGALRSYLLMSAKGDLRNALGKITVATFRKEQFIQENVELGPPTSEQEIDREEIKRRMQSLLPTATDKEIIALMFDGIRATSAFARALGVDGAPEETQKATVKKNKDRIIKVLHRAVIDGRLKKAEADIFQ
jgi:hypothetical protein